MQRPFPSKMRAGRPVVSALALAAASFAMVGAGCSEPSTSPEEPRPEDGVDPSVSAAPGEARAGRLRSGDDAAEAAFGGIASEARAGDVKLYNSRVQFVIQGAYPGHGYVPTGGNIIDADLVRAADTLGRDTIDDIFLSFGIGRLFSAESVSVIADGSDGGPAVVRAWGRDVPWDFIQGAVESDEPLLPDQYLDIVADYELAPEALALQVTTTFTNTGTEANRFNPTEGFLASAEDLWPWAAGRGLAGPEGDALAALGAVGKYGEATLSVWPEEGFLALLGLTSIVSSAGLVAATHGWMDLEPGASLTLVRHLAIAPDPLAAEAERRRQQGLALVEVEGIVTDSSTAAAVEGVWVHFVESESDSPWVAGFTTTDADGRFTAELPPGSWDVYAVARAVPEFTDLPVGAGRYAPFAQPAVNDRQLRTLSGLDTRRPIPMAAGRATQPPNSIVLVEGTVSPELALQVGPAGRLAVSVTDGTGNPIPAAIEVRHGVDGTPPVVVPAELREALGVPGPSTTAAWIWTSDGEVEIPVLPGSYDLLVEHSWRHDRATVEAVQVPPSGVGQASAVLAELIPRDGWMAMDSHLHAAPSNDGTLSMEDRLITCAATGVEIPVHTDHDRHADYRPLASALGLDDQLLAVPGVEISPVIRGHFNVFPVEALPAERPNGGAESWWFVPADTEALFVRMRASGIEDAVLQVNHGRSGMFDFANYDPTSGTPMRPDYWSWDFDAFELVNSTSQRNWEPLRTDWFSFLDVGRIKLPTGVSDSHSRTAPCGYGRTDLHVGVTDPLDLSLELVGEAIRSGHAVVAGGVTLRVTMQADEPEARVALPGDQVVGGSASMSVRVQAPAWMAPNRVRLYRNGVIEIEETLTGTKDGVTWYQDTWFLETETDSWFVVEVEGDQSLGGVWKNGLPYAATNAFFVDVDGDGWEAPGIAGLR